MSSIPSDLVTKKRRNIRESAKWSSLETEETSLYTRAGVVMHLDVRCLGVFPRIFG